jgi:hypothetical protein
LKIEQAFVDMFREEWRLMRGAAPLRRIAIVDEKPAGQYLAPEFELFQGSCSSQHGIAAVVADPGEFTRDGNRLLHRARWSTWFTTGSPTFLSMLRSTPI